MDLATIWFVLIAVLWSGYFLLEGFDFGVGMLLPVLPRDEAERSTMFESIGPVWDGNEVWLVIAGGATFAAFPAWYATMFSGFYLALLLILVLLIVRVVSFEWRERSDSPRWRATWLWANTVGSVGAAFVWGVALANLVHGVPLSSKGDFTGNVLDLFNAYTVLAGISVVALFALHGGVYLTLRTSGELCERAALAARRLAVPATVVVTAFLASTVAVAIDRNDRDAFPTVLPAAIGVVALVAAVALVFARRSGWAFVASAVAAVAWVATVFTGLYPRVLVSHPDFGNSLTISGAAAGHYALSVITVVAAICVPIVLLYQGWTYHVFRARLGGESRRRVRPSRSTAAPPACRWAEQAVARPRSAPRPPHAVRASAPGARHRARPRHDRLRAACRRRCWRRIVAGAFAGAAGFATCDATASLLALAFAGRGALAWGMEVAGRRAACERALRAAPRARRAPAGDAADGGRRDAVRRDRCGRGAGRRGARGVLRPLPAAGRARVDRAVRRRGVGGDRRPRVGARDGAHAAARAGLHVAHRPRHRAAHPRALARAAAAVDGLPRRRARPADAALVQSRQRAGGPHRRGQRAPPPRDDGDAAPHVPVGDGARAGRDPRRRARGGDGRGAAGRRGARASRPG